MSFLSQSESFSYPGEGLGDAGVDGEKRSCRYTTFRGKMNKTTIFKICALTCILLFSVLQTVVYAAQNNDRVKENISILKKTKACPGCDLKGAVLNRLDLSGADLEGADLRGAKVYLADLSKANLKKADLQGAVFGGSDLSGANLTGANLEGADLSTAYLVGAKIDHPLTKAKYNKGEFVGKTEKIATSQSIRQNKKSKPENIAGNGKGENQESPAAKQGAAVATKNIEKSSEQEMGSGKSTTEKAVAQINRPENKKAAEKAQAGLSSPAENIASPAQKALTEKTGVHTVSAVKAEQAGATSKPAKTTKTEEQSAVAAGNQQASPNAAVGTSEPTTPKPQTSTAEKKPVAVSSDQRTESSITSTKILGHGMESVTAPGKGEFASKEQTKSDQAIVEKNIIPGKKSKKGNEPEKVAATTSHPASGKADNLKRLLDSKQCYHCDLSGLDLSGKDLDEADLEGANLTGSNLKGADLNQAILKGAVLVDADLKNADLKGADLYKADFSGANLTGADMKGARLDETKFDGTIGRQR